MTLTMWIILVANRLVWLLSNLSIRAREHLVAKEEKKRQARNST
jgi:hypothetical protein